MDVELLPLCDPRLSADVPSTSLYFGVNEAVRIAIENAAQTSLGQPQNDSSKAVGPVKDHIRVSDDNIRQSREDAPKPGHHKESHVRPSSQKTLNKQSNVSPLNQTTSGSRKQRGTVNDAGGPRAVNKNVSVASTLTSGQRRTGTERSEHGSKRSLTKPHTSRKRKRKDFEEFEDSFPSMDWLMYDADLSLHLPQLSLFAELDCNMDDPMLLISLCEVDDIMSFHKQDFISDINNAFIGRKPLFTSVRFPYRDRTSVRLGQLSLQTYCSGHFSECGPVSRVHMVCLHQWASREPLEKIVRNLWRDNHEVAASLPYPSVRSVSDVVCYWLSSQLCYLMSDMGIQHIDPPDVFIGSAIQSELTTNCLSQMFCRYVDFLVEKAEKYFEDELCGNVRAEKHTGRGVKHETDVLSFARNGGKRAKLLRKSLRTEVLSRETTKLSSILQKDVEFDDYEAVHSELEISGFLEDADLEQMMSLRDNERFTNEKARGYGYRKDQAPAAHRKRKLPKDYDDDYEQWTSDVRSKYGRVHRDHSRLLSREKENKSGIHRRKHDRQRPRRKDADGVKSSKQNLQPLTEHEDSPDFVVYDEDGSIVVQCSDAGRTVVIEQAKSGETAKEDKLKSASTIPTSVSVSDDLCESNSPLYGVVHDHCYTSVSCSAESLANVMSEADPSKEKHLTAVKSSDNDKPDTPLELTDVRENSSTEVTRELADGRKSDVEGSAKKLRPAAEHVTTVSVKSSASTKPVTAQELTGACKRVAAKAPLRCELTDGKKSQLPVEPVIDKTAKELRRTEEHVTAFNVESHDKSRHVTSLELTGAGKNADTKAPLRRDLADGKKSKLPVDPVVEGAAKKLRPAEERVTTVSTESSDNNKPVTPLESVDVGKTSAAEAPLRRELADGKKSLPVDPVIEGTAKKLHPSHEHLSAINVKSSDSPAVSVTPPQSTDAGENIGAKVHSKHEVADSRKSQLPAEDTVKKLRPLSSLSLVNPPSLPKMSAKEGMTESKKPPVTEKPVQHKKIARPEEPAKEKRLTEAQEKRDLGENEYPKISKAETSGATKNLREAGSVSVSFSKEVRISNRKELSAVQSKTGVTPAPNVSKIPSKKNSVQPEHTERVSTTVDEVRFKTAEPEKASLVRISNRKEPSAVQSKTGVTPAPNVSKISSEKNRVQPENTEKVSTTVDQVGSKTAKPEKASPVRISNRKELSTVQSKTGVTPAPNVSKISSEKNSVQPENTEKVSTIVDQVGSKTAKPEKASPVRISNRKELSTVQSKTGVTPAPNVSKISSEKNSVQPENTEKVSATVDQVGSKTGEPAKASPDVTELQSVSVNNESKIADAEFSVESDKTAPAELLSSAALAAAARAASHYEDAYLSELDDAYGVWPLSNFDASFDPTNVPGGHVYNPFRKTWPILQHVMDGKTDLLLKVCSFPDVSTFSIRRVMRENGFLWAVCLSLFDPDMNKTDSADGSFYSSLDLYAAKVKGAANAKSSNPLMQAFRQAVEAKKKVAVKSKSSKVKHSFDDAGETQMWSAKRPAGKMSIVFGNAVKSGGSLSAVVATDQPAKTAPPGTTFRNLLASVISKMNSDICDLISRKCGKQCLDDSASNVEHKSSLSVTSKHLSTLSDLAVDVYDVAEYRLDKIFDAKDAEKMASAKKMEQDNNPVVVSETMTTAVITVATATSVPHVSITSLSGDVTSSTSTLLSSVNASKLSPAEVTPVSGSVSTSVGLASVAAQVSQPSVPQPSAAKSVASSAASVTTAGDKVCLSSSVNGVMSGNAAVSTTIPATVKVTASAIADMLPPPMPPLSLSHIGVRFDSPVSAVTTSSGLETVTSQPSLASTASLPAVTYAATFSNPSLPLEQLAHVPPLSMQPNFYSMQPPIPPSGLVDTSVPPPPIASYPPTPWYPPSSTAAGGYPAAPGGAYTAVSVPGHQKMTETANSAVSCASASGTLQTVSNTAIAGSPVVQNLQAAGVVVTSSSAFSQGLGQGMLQQGSIPTASPKPVVSSLVQGNRLLGPLKTVIPVTRSTPRLSGPVIRQVRPVSSTASTEIASASPLLNSDVGLHGIAAVTGPTSQSAGFQVMSQSSHGPLRPVTSQPGPLVVGQGPLGVRPGPLVSQPAQARVPDSQLRGSSRPVFTQPNMANDQAAGGPLSGQSPLGAVQPRQPASQSIQPRGALPVNQPHGPVQPMSAQPSQPVNQPRAAFPVVIQSPHDTVQPRPPVSQSTQPRGALPVNQPRGPIRPMLAQPGQPAIQLRLRGQSPHDTVQPRPSVTQTAPPRGALPVNQPHGPVRPMTTQPGQPASQLRQAGPVMGQGPRGTIQPQNVGSLASGTPTRPAVSRPPSSPAQPAGAVTPRPSRPMTSAAGGGTAQPQKGPLLTYRSRVYVLNSDSSPLCKEVEVSLIMLFL